MADITISGDVIRYIQAVEDHVNKWTIRELQRMDKMPEGKVRTQLHIIARGNQLTHIVNGQLMAILIDDDPTMAKRSGLIGLQIQTGVGKVSYRNLWLKTY